MDYASLTIEQQLALVRTELANSAKFQTLIDQWTAIRTEFSMAEASLQTEAGGLANQWTDEGGKALQAGVAESLKSLKPWANAADVATILHPLRQQIIDTEKLVSALVAERAALEAYEEQFDNLPTIAGAKLYTWYRKGAIQREGGGALNVLAQSLRDASTALEKAIPTTTWYGPEGGDPAAAVPPADGTSPGVGGRGGAPGGGGSSGSFDGLDSETAALAGSAPYGGVLPASYTASPGGQGIPSAAMDVPGAGGFGGNDPGLDGAPVPALPPPTVPGIPPVPGGPLVPGGPTVPGAPTFPGPPPPWTGMPPPQPRPRMPQVPTGPFIPRSVPDPGGPIVPPPAPGTLGGRAARGGQGGFRLPAIGTAGGVGGLPGIPGGTGAADAAAGSTQPGRGVIARATAGPTAGSIPGTAIPGTTAAGTALAGTAAAGSAAGSAVPPPMMPPMAPGQAGDKPKPGNAERAKQIRRPAATFPGVPVRLRGRADGTEPNGFGSVAAASQQTARRREREAAEPETLRLLDEELWDVTAQPQRNRPTAV